MESLGAVHAHHRTRWRLEWRSRSLIMLVIMVSFMSSHVAGQGFTLGTAGPGSPAVREQRAQIFANASRAAIEWRRAHTPAGAKELARLKICVAPSAPYTFCDPLSNTTKYSGFEVELWRYLALSVPWLGKEGENWYFTCGDYTPSFDDITSPNGTCLLVAGGLSSTNSKPRGSLSVLTKGFAILMRNDAERKKSLFSPFFAFSIGLWMALIGTAALVGVALWLLETAARAMDREPQDPNHDKAACPLCTCAIHRHLPGGAAGVASGGSGSGSDGGGGGKVDDAGDRAERGASSGGGGGSGSGCAHDRDDDTAPRGRVDTNRAGRHGARNARAAAAVAAASPARRGGTEKFRRRFSLGGGGGGAGNGVSRNNSALRRSASQSIVQVLEAGHDTTIEAVEKLDTTVRQIFLHLASVSSFTTVSNSTLPAQVVLWAWGLLTIVTISMFTAATAAKLTTSAFETGITGLGDLRGMTVIVWSGHLNEGRYENSGIIPVAMDWENLQDDMDMINALRQHKGDAIIQDSNYAAYYAGTECDLVQAGERWGQRFVAYIWSLKAPSAMIDSVDFALREAMESGTVTALRSSHIDAPVSRCSAHRELVSKTTTIKFGQVAGLWVILAIAMLGAFGATGFMLVTRRFRAKQRARLKRATSVNFSRRPSGLA